MDKTRGSSGQTGTQGQRDALKQSEKKASEKQPGSFKEKETDQKVVGIPPAAPGKKPIRGLDSK